MFASFPQHNGINIIVNTHYITSVSVQKSISTDKFYFKVNMTDRVIEMDYTLKNYYLIRNALGMDFNRNKNHFTGNLLSEDFPDEYEE